jgi:hypothetical protein
MPTTPRCTGRQPKRERAGANASRGSNGSSSAAKDHRGSPGKWSMITASRRRAGRLQPFRLEVSPVGRLGVRGAPFAEHHAATSSSHDCAFEEGPESSSLTITRRPPPSIFHRCHDGDPSKRHTRTSSFNPFSELVRRLAPSKAPASPWSSRGVSPSSWAAPSTFGAQPSEQGDAPPTAQVLGHSTMSRFVSAGAVPQGRARVAWSAR